MGQKCSVRRQAAPPEDRLAPALAAQLVARAAQGDATAWELLVRSYVGLVWAIARNHRLRQEDAADVVQLTWLRLVEHVDRLQNPERVGAWLATTARHEALRLRRRSRRETAVPDLPELAAAVTRDLEPADVEPDEDLLRQIGEAFVALPERSQALMRLLVLDPPPSYAEIASALDMPVGSIGPTRGRCLKALRDHLSPVGRYRARPVGDF
jgi:RNA polymerase sigma factor (sigma-70 family)